MYNNILLNNYCVHVFFLVWPYIFMCKNTIFYIIIIIPVHVLIMTFIVAVYCILVTLIINHS